MARTISDEELQLKQRARRRLIGAVVLVTAIVVVLPMVLDSEPRQVPGKEVSVQIPSPDSGAFTSKAVPLNPSPAPKSEPQPQPGPEAKAESKSEPRPESKTPEPVKAAPATPVEEPKKAAALTPAPAAKEAPKEASRPVEKAAAEPAKPAPARETAAKPPVKAAKPAAKSKEGQYVVQVIALADAGRARQMQQQIAAAGIKSYTEIVKTSKGEVTRVRAGPFATRAAAEKARDQLKALGMSGNVTTR